MALNQKATEGTREAGRDLLGGIATETDAIETETGEGERGPGPVNEIMIENTETQEIVIGRDRGSERGITMIGIHHHHLIENGTTGIGSGMNVKTDTGIIEKSARSDTVRRNDLATTSDAKGLHHH